MLPELTRVMWTSAHAREVWEPRIGAVSRAWQAVEFESVAQGLRAAALTTIASERLAELTAKFASQGLVLQALGQVARGGSYSVSERDAVDGQPWDYRAFALAPRAVQIAQEAWATQGPERDERIGALLGFPLCCRQFFRRVWVDQGLRDTTWEMGPLGTAGPPEANILLRWLGVRLVPHLPCSFTCEATVKQGRQFAALMPERERRWAYELLSWPMRWTAKNGVAELETPCFKVNTTTDACSTRREIRRDGVAPAEGATGIRFPYLAPRRNEPAAPTCHSNEPKDTSALANDDVAQPVHFLVDTWTDNGFLTKVAMDEAHQMILDALRRSPPAGYVADLGAGNGQLISKIRSAYPSTFVGGIELDKRKAAKHDAISCDDLRKLLASRSIFDTLVVSRRRFEEIPGLEHWCLTHSRQVICYSYDEPMGVEVLQWDHIRESKASRS